MKEVCLDLLDNQVFQELLEVQVNKDLLDLLVQSDQQEKMVNVVNKVLKGQEGREDPLVLMENLVHEEHLVRLV